MIHVYLSAKTSRIKNFHVVRAVKNSIRWRKQNSMKRIVATEKLQELNLQSQSDFFGAAEISRWEWYPHCPYSDPRHICADSKTYNYLPGGTFGSANRVSLS